MSWLIGLTRYFAGNGGGVLRACIVRYKRSLGLERLRDAWRERAYCEAFFARREHQAQMHSKRRLYQIYTEAIERIEARRRENLSF